MVNSADSIYIAPHCQLAQQWRNECSLPGFFLRARPAVDINVNNSSPKGNLRENWILHTSRNINIALSVLERN